MSKSEQRKINNLLSPWLWLLFWCFFSHNSLCLFYIVGIILATKFCIIILVTSVNIWLTFFLWLSLLSCGYTTFQYFIPFKRKKLPSFLNTNSPVGYESSFFLFGKSMYGFVNNISSLPDSCIKDIGQRPALGTGQLISILDFGDQFRYILSQCTYCILCLSPWCGI